MNAGIVYTATASLLAAFTNSLYFSFFMMYVLSNVYSKLNTSSIGKVWGSNSINAFETSKKRYFVSLNSFNAKNTAPIAGSNFGEANLALGMIFFVSSSKGLRT